MPLHILAGFDGQTLRPLSRADVYRRATRRAQITAEMSRVAKASVRAKPAAESRLASAVREFRSACVELVIACALAAPVACGYVFYLAEKLT